MFMNRTHVYNKQVDNNNHTHTHNIEKTFVSSISLQFLDTTDVYVRRTHILSCTELCCNKIQHKKKTTYIVSVVLLFTIHNLLLTIYQFSACSYTYFRMYLVRKALFAILFRFVFNVFSCIFRVSQREKVLLHVPFTAVQRYKEEGVTHTHTDKADIILMFLIL